MESLIEDIAGDQLLGYTLVSIAALVCYEYVIMLPNEIRYLWTRHISFGSALLFLCRYLPFVVMVQIYFFVSASVLHQPTCILGFRTSTCIVFVEFLLSILVLFTRAYAVWGGPRTMLYFLGATYAGVIVGGSISVHLFMSGVGSLPLVGSPGCLVQIANDDLWIALTILILSESLAFALLIYKSLMHARELKNVEIDRSESQDILSVMARDGVAYFACNLAITTTNLFLLKSVNPDFQDILIIMQGALENLLCGRLLFHIRTVNDSTLGTNSSRTTLTWHAATKGSLPVSNLSFDEDDNDYAESHTTIIDLTPVDEVFSRAKWSGDIEKGPLE